MKNFIVIVVCLLTLGSTFSSCAYLQPTTNNRTANGEAWLSLKCFQALSNTSTYSDCLAWNANYDVFYIVHFTCPTSKKTEVYYDDKSLNGKYVFVGTYTYESKERTKTVRAYMSKENFSEWYEYDKNTLIDLLDVVLSYNSVKSM